MQSSFLLHLVGNHMFTHGCCQVSYTKHKSVIHVHMHFQDKQLSIINLLMVKDVQGGTYLSSAACGNHGNTRAG